MSNINTINNKILSIIQHDFPICHDPYAEIGGQVGCSREVAFNIVKELYKDRLIRRIGSSFSAKGMNYISTLVAAKVNNEKIESIAAHAGNFLEVTHNYERSGEYNLWFTIIAESQQRLDQIFNSVKLQPGVLEIRCMPAGKQFKLRVEFKA